MPFMVTWVYVFFEIIYFCRSKIVQSNGYDGGSSGSHCKEDVDKSGGNNVKNVSNQATMCSISDSNGNVSFILSYLTCNFMYHVP